jgi:hypothetical protein
MTFLHVHKIDCPPRPSSNHVIANAGWHSLRRPLIFQTVSPAEGIGAAAILQDSGTSRWQLGS